MSIKLVLDPGHGGNDSGAIGNGLQEKRLTLQIAQKIEALLKEYENIEVKLTRTNDKYLTLQERCNIANEWGADYFISIHINSASSKLANGFESFIASQSTLPKTQAFQNVIHEEIMKQIPEIKDRGKKKASFHVLNNTNMPALLTENLFIVNTNEAKKLALASFQQKIALGHVIGLEKFLGLKRKVTEEPKTAKLYKVHIQMGAFASKENAQALLDRYREEGYMGHIVEE